MNNSTVMKRIIKKRIEEIKGFYYGDGLMGEKIIIDRRKYKGLGRPRKSDYITLKEAQKQINGFMNAVIIKRYDTTGTVTINK